MNVLVYEGAGVPKKGKKISIDYLLEYENRLTLDIHNMMSKLSFPDICFHEHQNSIYQISVLDPLEWRLSQNI